MKIRIAIIGFALGLAACGDDSSSDNNVNSDLNNLVSNNAAFVSGWTMQFAGGEEVFDLPDIDGDDLDDVKLGDSLTFTGLDVAAGLSAKISVGAAVEATDYAPTMFTVSWEDHDWICSGTAVTMSVTGLNPTRGTWAGTLGCVLTTAPTEMFETTLTGDFTSI